MGPTLEIVDIVPRVENGKLLLTVTVNARDERGCEAVEMQTVEIPRAESVSLAKEILAHRP